MTIFTKHKYKLDTVSRIQCTLKIYSELYKTYVFPYLASIIRVVSIHPLFTWIHPLLHFHSKYDNTLVHLSLLGIFDNIQAVTLKIWRYSGVSSCSELNGADRADRSRKYKIKVWMSEFKIHTQMNVSPHRYIPYRHQNIFQVCVLIWSSRFII